MIRICLISLATVVSPVLELVGQQCPTRPEVRINQPSFGEARVVQSCISPDGTWVAYDHFSSSGGNLTWKVVARRADGTTPVNAPLVLKDLSGSPQYLPPWLTWRSYDLNGTQRFDAHWCNGGNAIEGRMINANGTMGATYTLTYVQLARYIQLQRQAFHKRFAFSYTKDINGVPTNFLAVDDTSGAAGFPKVIDSSTTQYFAPLDVDPSEQYVFYTRTNGNGQESVRRNISTLAQNLIGPQSSAGLEFTYDSGFFGNNKDEMVFTHELRQAVTKRYTVSSYAPLTPPYVDLTWAGAENHRYGYVQPAHLKPTGSPTKRWAVYSSKVSGFYASELAMLPLGGGGQVLFDKLQTAGIIGVSMDWDAETLCFSTYSDWPSYDGDVYVLDTSKNATVDNRPIEASPRAINGGNFSTMQPNTIGDICSLFLSVGLGPAPVTLPGVCGTVEIDTAAMLPIYVGTIGTGQPITTNHTIPLGSAMVGASVLLQGLRTGGSTNDISRVVRIRIVQ